MAIMKMKRLRLIAMAEDRETILRTLQRMGCVEVSEAGVEPSEEGDASGRELLQHLRDKVSRLDASGLERAREERGEAERALATLKRYAPEKGKLLQPRPDLTEGELFDQGRARQALDGAQEVNEAERRMAAIHSEQSKLLAQKAALAPWLELDLPLETQSTHQIMIQLGTLPANRPFEEGEQAVQGAGELVQLTQISADRELRYCLLVCHTSQEEGALEALKALGWSRANLRDWTGTAAENTVRLDRELEELAKELAQLEEKLASMGHLRPQLQQLADLAQVESDREESRGRLLNTSQTFYLEGWVPEENWPQLEKALEKYPCAYEAADPVREEYPDVPVKLKNNWLTRPLSMVTDMYSLPAYGTVDPNPLMAPFFILFYGMMMADMGYGLLMMAVAWVVVKRAKPEGATMRHMFPLLGLCGVSTFIWGAVTGSFFGDFLTQMVALTTGGQFALPALFSPVDDALAVLVGSLVLGLAQIFTGMGISMYRKIKRGAVMEALCGEGAWYLVFLLAGVAALTGQIKACAIAIVVLLLLTQGYGKKGIVGKLVGIGGSLYNNITGYFSDILSYSRLMALMLAGAVVAQVFNTLGSITNFLPTFILISMIGNALNFALNLLGCYVHDMRLQCLEYFKYYYEDGGKPFRPLEFKTKYYHIVKE